MTRSICLPLGKSTNDGELSVQNRYTRFSNNSTYDMNELETPFSYQPTASHDELDYEVAVIPQVFQNQLNAARDSIAPTEIEKSTELKTVRFSSESYGVNKRQGRPSFFNDQYDDSSSDISDADIIASNSITSLSTLPIIVQITSILYAFIVIITSIALSISSNIRENIYQQSLSKGKIFMRVKDSSVHLHLNESLNGKELLENVLMNYSTTRLNNYAEEWEKFQAMYNFSEKWERWHTESAAPQNLYILNQWYQTVMHLLAIIWLLFISFDIQYVKMNLRRINRQKVAESTNNFEKALKFQLKTSTNANGSMESGRKSTIIPKSIIPGDTVENEKNPGLFRSIFNRFPNMNHNSSYASGMSEMTNIDDVEYSDEESRDKYEQLVRKRKKEILLEEVRKNDQPHFLQIPVRKNNARVLAKNLTLSKHAKRKLIEESVLYTPYGYFFNQNMHSGGLYMRIGCGIFAMITIMKHAVSIAYLIDEHAWTYHEISFHASYIVFAFLQFFFLFRSANIIIFRFSSLAFLGLMHVIVTNFCYWTSVIFHELRNELSHQSNHKTVGGSMFNIEEIFLRNDNTIENRGAPVSKSSGETLRYTSMILANYLYPCGVEYSLVAIAVLIMIWSTVGKIDKSVLKTYARNAQKRFIFNIDCHKSAIGIAYGLLIMIGSIVVIIVSSVLSSDTTETGKRKMALIMHQSTNMTLLLIGCITMMAAWLQTSKMKLHLTMHSSHIDQNLIFVAMIGVYTLASCSLLATIFCRESPIVKHCPNIVNQDFILTILINILILVQSTSQTLFILDGLRRRPRDLRQARDRPGRKAITLMIMLNITQWMCDSFGLKSAERFSHEKCFYENQWTLIYHVCEPLFVFYRFHSSICLSDIWKNAYLFDEKSDEIE
ncbi:hypothetical protein SNEBB_008105 [Seison nebaliae]|nr:hypothetical protein SNEBB_008105 [Seison nebaliae]